MTILRVESISKLGTLVHVRVDGIHFDNCTGKPSPNAIEHAPFTRVALEASVLAQTATLAKLPDFHAGYQEWLSHCGGAYSVPVERVVALIDAQFGTRIGCH